MFLLCLICKRSYVPRPVSVHWMYQKCSHWEFRELTILGRERRPRLQKTKTAITEIKAVQLFRKDNLKDLLSE